MDVADLKKAKELSKQLAGFSAPPALKITKKKAKNTDFLNRVTGLNIPKKRTERYRAKPTPFKFDYGSLKAQNIVPTHDVLKGIIEPIVLQRLAEISTVKDSPIVTDELVKDIIKVMHSLPESDKLEVSKGLRNAQSFIFNGTRYKTEELMHGGSADSTVTQVVSVDLSAQCNGSNKIFTIPAFTTGISLIGSDAPIVYRPTIDYSASVATLTLAAAVNAPSSGATLIWTYA